MKNAAHVVCLSLVAAALAAACTARADEEKKKVYALSVVTDPQAVKKDAKASYTLTITPESPWLLKTSTPLKIKLDSSEGIKLEKDLLGPKDIVDEKTAAKAVRTSFDATAAGEQRIGADLTFFLCTEEICKRFKDKLETKLQVE